MVVLGNSSSDRWQFLDSECVHPARQGESGRGGGMVAISALVGPVRHSRTYLIVNMHIDVGSVLTILAAIPSS